MVCAGQRQLAYAVSGCVCIDPEKEVWLKGNANRNLVLGWPGKRRIDNNHIANAHKTP